MFVDGSLLLYRSLETDLVALVLVAVSRRSFGVSCVWSHWPPVGQKASLRLVYVGQSCRMRFTVKGLCHKDMVLMDEQCV